MPVETLLAFAGTCLVIELTPGPNMIYLVILSLTKGPRAGLAAVAGIALGLAVVGIAAALGLAALISGSTLAYEVLRWGGIAYLLWLAFEGWQSAGETSPHAAGGPAGDEDGGDGTRQFTRGLITNLLNPKAGVFYVAVLPEFLSAGGPLIVNSIILALIYVAIATAIHAVIVLTAARARPLLEHPGRSRFIRRSLSVVLAGIAIWFAISTAR